MALVAGWMLAGREQAKEAAGLVGGAEEDVYGHPLYSVFATLYLIVVAVAGNPGIVLWQR